MHQGDTNRRQESGSGARALASDGGGQSEALGLVLLLGIAVIGIGVALALGFSAFDAGKDRADVGQAERSFSQLDREASAVALGDAGVRDVDLGLRANDGQLRTEPGAGWLRVEVVNGTDGSLDWSTQETLGAVVYESDGTTVAYQGGGVWRADGNGSVVVSRPEFHYRDGTLTIPIVAVGGAGGVDSGVQITRAGSTERRFPVKGGSPGERNRITNGKVRVTVHSEYYEAWGAYFERSTNAYVYYDDANQQATAVFLAVPRWGTLDDGIIATSGAGKLRLVATGAYIDSYDSAAGSYAATRSANGTVRAVGDILTKADSQILGDVYSGDTVSVEQDSKVDGDAFWTKGFSVENTATVTGDNQTIDGVPAITPIDGFVRASAERVRNRSDNDATTVVQSRELAIGGGSAELGAGYYDLENLHLDGERLELNTTNGDIYIAVEDWMKLERGGGVGSNLTVTGDGVVRVFVESEETTGFSLTGAGNRDVHLGVGKESDVSVQAEDSPQLRVYATQDFDAAIAGSNSQPASFVGVIYAPAGTTGDGRVYVKQADVFGQILTGNLTLGTKGAVHYDRALNGTPLPQSPTVARIEFLHVAVHPVNVSDASVRPVSPAVGAGRPALAAATPALDARALEATGKAPTTAKAPAAAQAPTTTEAPAAATTSSPSRVVARDSRRLLRISSA